MTSIVHGNRPMGDVSLRELTRCAAWSRFGIPNILHNSDQETRFTDYDVPHFVDATPCTDDPHRSELDIPQSNEAARKAESARLRDASILQLLRYGSH